MVKFNKNEIKKLIEVHFSPKKFKIIDISGSGRGSNGYPVIIEEFKKGKFFLKIVKKDKINQRDIDFEIATLKELSKINNPNVVKLLDVIDAGRGFIILKFQFIPGKTLEELIKERSAIKHHFSADEVYKFGQDILNALKSIDAIGKVHHDIKPKNIKYDGKKYVLLDLGIGRFKESVIIGKRSKAIFKYSSPEQLLSWMNITPRPAVSIQSDLFSLGVLMYEMATLQYPFGNGDFDKIINSVIDISPNKINTAISNDLTSIIMRLLRRYISERFLNISDLEKCLNEKTYKVKKHKFAKSVFYLQHHPSSTRFPNFLEYKTIIPSINVPEGIIFSTSFFPKDDKKLGALIGQEYKFLVDPETYFLPFKSKSHKSFLQYTKYNLKSDDYFTELITKKRIDWWVNEVITHQLNKGADFIITPTFLINNSTDKNFNLNFILIQKTIKACKNRGLSKPIICHYVVKRDFICDDRSRDFLISQIVTLDDIHAILLTAESDVQGMREPKSEIRLLAALKDFIEKANQKFPIILNYAGTESIPLFAYGLCGAVTNMYKTNFRTDILSDTLSSAGGGRSNSYYYVPGLMNFLEIQEISVLFKGVERLKKENKISSKEREQILSALKCNCPFCKNAGVFVDESKIDSWSERDLDNHYLFHVVYESKYIWSMDEKNAKQYIAKKIERAMYIYQLISKKLVIEKFKKASSGSFLNSWKKVFS